MNVNDFDKYILSYLEDDLSESERKDFDTIIKDNPECKDKLIAHNNIIKELSNIENIVDLPDGFEDRLYTRIDEISPGFSNRMNDQSNDSSSNIKKFSNILFNYNYPILRIAAGLAIFMFSVTIFWSSNNKSNDSSGKFLSTRAVFDSEKLADSGLDSTLDSNSSLNNTEDNLPIKHVNDTRTQTRY